MGWSKEADGLKKSQGIRVERWYLGRRWDVHYRSLKEMEQRVNFNRSQHDDRLTIKGCLNMHTDRVHVDLRIKMTAADASSITATG